MSGQPKVRFTLGQGGLNRPLDGFDHYSAMICYDYAGIATAAYANMFGIYTSIKDAEDDGIVTTCAEATAATSDQTVTLAGTDGDTINIAVLKWDGTTVDLGTYTKITADNTPTLVAAGIIAAINAKTYVHGFTAAAGAAGHYIITAPKTYGTYLNTKSTTNTITGTATITNAAFAGGTKSQLAMYHYQIAEYFRGNPLGVLYFDIKWDDSAQSAALFNAQVQADGLAIQNLFEGQARQFLVYNPFRAFATSTLTSLKALRTTLFAQYTPAVFYYVGGFTGTLQAQANLRALTADGVGCVIGQSGSGLGLELSYTQQTVIGSGGLALGVMSSSAVSQCIGEVQAFPMNDGVECEIAHFFDRTDYNTITTALGDQLHDYGYTFLRKFKGKTGTYFNSDPAAIAPSSDYAYLSDSRTIDKAVRGVYVSILDLLNSRNRVNSDGTLSEASIAAYNEKANNPLDQMMRDEDIANKTIQVDRTALVATTGIVPIYIGLQKTPTSREISITIGFRASI
jgi:hypothetical protein